MSRINPRIGVGTPQANPTVEAEFRALLPPEVAFVTTRLTSASPSARQRLVDYLEQLPAYLQAFGGMTLDLFCFGCTGSSYLLGHDGEQRALARAAGFGYPILTATAAIESRLRQLSARRILLVAPYPAWLLESAAAYWAGRGFSVGQVVRVATRSEEDTTTIYELTSADALAAAVGLDTAGADAVVFSGTGMPSAEILAEAGRLTGLPTLSSNAALVGESLRMLGKLPS